MLSTKSNESSAKRITHGTMMVRKSWIFMSRDTMVRNDSSAHRGISRFARGSLPPPAPNMSVSSRLMSSIFASSPGHKRLSLLLESHITVSIAWLTDGNRSLSLSLTCCSDCSVASRISGVKVAAACRVCRSGRLTSRTPPPSRVFRSRLESQA